MARIGPLALTPETKASQVSALQRGAATQRVSAMLRRLATMPGPVTLEQRDQLLTAVMALEVVRRTS